MYGVTIVDSGDLPIRRQGKGGEKEEQVNQESVCYEVIFHTVYALLMLFENCLSVLKGSSS